ncbi:tetraspanin [Phlyctema vagabunda]|uniref:Tetraspanin n=1 Tax=Phlyctema vagabunda TaxID=108571 RepID=A0ABR4PG62_9HELO
MRDNILLTYIAMDILFVVCGGLLLIFSLTTQAQITATPRLDNIARNLLLDVCPLKGAIGNAVIIFVGFIVSLPAMVIPTSRGWAKLHGYFVGVSAMYTLVLGLYLWFETLKTRTNLFAIWNAQPAASQSLLQEALVCCGYFNSTTPAFVVDSVCPTAALAATQIGCVTPFSSFANNFLDTIFTGAFGIVGVDVALIITIAILLKDRKEKERYRHIDEKNGISAF